MRNSIKINPARASSAGPIDQTAKEATMDLYFSPLACSMATRIALYEAGAEANYLEVDPKTKVVQNDGSDFTKLNPLGLVPTLRTDDGLVLTENAAILQYVAEHYPQAGISTGPGMERSRLHQWLCFIGTELQDQWKQRSFSAIAISLIEASRRRIRPCSSNSHCSL